MVNFVEIASVIQMAVAPAFLLTGVGAILAVMTARLTRIVDRFRVLHEGSNERSKYKQKELSLLILRGRWTHNSFNNDLRFVYMYLNCNDFYIDRN